MEYHLIFIIISFIFFLIVMFFLFIEPDFNRAIASFIFCILNGVITAMNALSFFGIGINYVDPNGVFMTEAYHDMYIFSILFVVLFYMNILLLVYCIYLFYKKPWEQVRRNVQEERFYANP